MNHRQSTIDPTPARLSDQRSSVGVNRHSSHPAIVAATLRSVVSMDVTASHRQIGAKTRACNSVQNDYGPLVHGLQVNSSTIERKGCFDANRGSVMLSRDRAWLICSA